jgi:hypothetical protein
MNKKVFFSVFVGIAVGVVALPPTPPHPHPLTHTPVFHLACFFIFSSRFFFFL